MNLLLVDDEPMVLELLKDAVEEVLPNATMNDFLDAEEALAFAEEHPIDIAFLDINMRILDGITMAKELQEMYPRINIIFCTGYTEYMPDAFEMYCSGYIVKPVTEEKIQKAVDHLRYEVNDGKLPVTFHCFGSFEAYFNDTPINFKYNRTKELLAYLVDRNGADCGTREIMAVLFEDEEKRSYFNNLRQDLLNTFEELGIGDVIRTSKGKLGINRELVSCDHFDYQDGKATMEPTEYMTQYAFAEMTYPLLFDGYDY
ncbi:MAG: response regulator [Lachnospiraceae bacterium]|nr:response regulator [Candidatus Equihabitans merdae]